MAEKIKIKDLPLKESILDTDIFLESNSAETFKVTAKSIAEYVNQNMPAGGTYLQRSELGQANGVAPLDDNGKIDGSCLPYGTTDSTVYSGLSGFVLEGNLNTHISDTANPHQVTREQLGLGQVDNTSDLDKPVSTAQQEAIDAERDRAIGAEAAKVDKVEGKQLSSNDYTTAEKEKLDGIAPNAQVNVIETIKVNGAALTPSFKSVDISIPTDYIVSGSQTVVSDSDGGDNIYTFTKADGNTSAFTIKNGSKGSSGPSGTRGSQIYWGTAVTGTDTAAAPFPSSGITSALVNDLYLNTDTWCIYQCTAEGNADTAKWIYKGTIKGEEGEAGAPGEAGPAGAPGVNATTTATGTASAPGLTKLYTSVGTNTDGTMTQSAITGQLESKVSKTGSNTISGTISPSADNTYNLGTISKKWSYIYGERICGDVQLDAGPYYGDTYADSTSYHSYIGKNFTNINNTAKDCLVIGHFNSEKQNGGCVSGSSADMNAFVIGNGTGSGSNSSNAFRVEYNGEVFGGVYSTSGADYAEYLEWKDKNTDREDRVGKFVTLIEDKIQIANAGEYIVGVISGNPSVIGNSDLDSWSLRYKQDVFGRYLYGDVSVASEDSNGNRIENVVENTRLFNDDYDDTLTYIPRSDRAEWDTVGMLGVLRVYDDGSCVADGYCKAADGGIATSASTEENSYLVPVFKVMKRISDNIVEIFFR